MNATSSLSDLDFKACAGLALILAVLGYAASSNGQISMSGDVVINYGNLNGWAVATIGNTSDSASLSVVNGAVLNAPEQLGSVYGGYPGRYSYASGNFGVAVGGLACGCGISYTPPLYYSVSSGQSSFNSLMVSGTGSLVQGGVSVGGAGSGNQVTVSNGGEIDGQLRLGRNDSFITSNNTALVTGPGSRVVSSGSVDLRGFGNSLTIQDGGQVGSGAGNSVIIGATSMTSTSTSNSVVVTGAGSLIQAGDLWVGDSGSMGNSLFVGAGAAVNVSGGGWVNIFSNNTATIAGTLSCTSLECYDGGVLNNSGTISVGGYCIIVTGSGLRNSGTIIANQFVFQTCTLSGVIVAAGAQLGHGPVPVAIGDGTNSATYVMQGGTHSFAPLTISSNSVLTGCGTVNGSVVNYGTIVLTNGCNIDFNGPVVNYGRILSLHGTPNFHSTFVNNGTYLQNTARITDLGHNGDDIVVRFNTVSNYLHDLQAANDPVSGTWASLANGLLGTGGPMAITDSGGATNSQRFYRLLLHY